MSTTFYAIKPPITSLRVNDDQISTKHNKVNVFISHQLAGVLRMYPDELHEFLLAQRGPALIVRFAGAEADGPKYHTIQDIPRDTVQLISEYGDVIDASELRSEMEEQKPRKLTSQERNVLGITSPHY